MLGVDSVDLYPNNDWIYHLESRYFPPVPMYWKLSLWQLVFPKQMLDFETCWDRYDVNHSKHKNSFNAFHCHWLKNSYNVIKLLWLITTSHKKSFHFSPLFVFLTWLLIHRLSKEPTTIWADLMTFSAAPPFREAEVSTCVEDHLEGLKKNGKTSNPEQRQKRNSYVKSWLMNRDSDSTKGFFPTQVWAKPKLHLGEIWPNYCIQLGWEGAICFQDENKVIVTPNGSSLCLENFQFKSHLILVKIM